MSRRSRRFRRRLRSLNKAKRQAQKNERLIQQALRMGEENRPAKKKTTSRRRFSPLRCFLLLLTAAAVIFGAYKLIKLPFVSVQEKSFPAAVFYRAKTVDNAEIGQGNLILVNSQTPYSFASEEEVVPIASKKNSAYQVKNDEIQLQAPVIRQFNRMFSSFERKTGLNNICIISAYRDWEYQENLFNERVNSDGYYTAIQWVAVPGYSEHHTGLAADIAVQKENGENSTFTGTDDYALVEQTAWQYGFIRRYPENKTDITGIANEPWHYRYVGAPHAYIMQEQDMCLEEYIQYVKNFTYAEQYLDVNLHGREYKIYYIPAEAGESTTLHVPRDGLYSLSGNNTDGFIVTEWD